MSESDNKVIDSDGLCWRVGVRRQIKLAAPWNILLPFTAPLVTNIYYKNHIYV